MTNPIPSAGEAMPKGPSPEYYAAWQQCREAGGALSRAMAALRDQGESIYACVYPDGDKMNLTFGDLEAAKAPSAALPVDRVERLSNQLAFALDDWNAQTNIQFMAHIYSASSGRGAYFENTRRHKDLPQGSDVAKTLQTLLLDAGRIIRDNPRLDIDRINVDEHGVYTFIKIPGVDPVTDGEA